MEKIHENTGPYLKKGMTRTTKLVGCLGKSTKKSQKLGDFFAGKSLDSGSTSGRGCLISNYMYAL